MATALPYRGNSGSTTASFERGPLHRHTSSSSNPANRSTSTSTGSNPKTRRLSRSPQPPFSASHNVDDGVQILSDHSSSSWQQQRAVTNKKPLRSQYPRGDPENHVEYILVASFDIDRGPIMEHQYPGPITGDENMLAELMLPDQAHVRNQDWTIFFLHKDAGEGMDGEQTGPANRKRRRKDNLVNEDPGDEEGVDEDDVDEEDEADETDELGDSQGPPLIYVLNLVYTKQDNTVKRGAVVKAMAICTRHSFLHIYKPLLLLALEEYYKAPYMETLASLYGAVNSMDLSLMPRLSILERFILQSTNIKEMFVEKFEQMIQQRVAEDEVSGNGASSTQNPKSTAELLKSVSSNKYQVPRDTHEYESRVLYNGIPIPIKVPVALSPETVGDFSLIKLIQTFSTPHSSQPQPFALHAHLTTGGAYTHPIIVLMNAMLTQKRIIFLGHNQPSGDVAEAVLAACSLASGGVLRGFVRHAFPYTDLSKIDDLLNVPGFIAGVTNPTFALHPEWWDLLCDLPTGRMKISNVIEPAPVTEGLVNFQQHNPAPSSGTSPALPTDPTGDAAFMEDVLRGISTRLGERAIRARWRDWVIKFTRIAAAFEESVYGASALYIGGEEADAGAAGVSGHGYVWGDEISRYRELSGNVNRIEGWRNTRSYYSFIQDLANLYTARPISNLDLEHQHDRLRTQKLSHDDAASIYLAFASTVHSYPEICQLLTVTLEAHGGLFYISLGLFHPRRDVRAAIVHLLDRIREHDAGRHIWNVLGRFAKIGFLRVKREVEAAEDGDRDVDP